MSTNDSIAFISEGAPGETQFRSKLTVIPVTLNLHYRHRLASRLALDGYAGFGLYLSRLTSSKRRMSRKPFRYTTRLKPRPQKYTTLKKLNWMAWDSR